MMADMTRRYCRAHGWKMKSGVPFNEYQTFLPYFFMDAAYQAWCHFEPRNGLEHERAQCASRITQAFSDYFRRYRAMFTKDEVDYLLELTDEFEAYIEHHILIASVAYMNAVADNIEFDTQKESANLWITNALAAVAQGWHGAVNPRTRFGDRRIDPDIATALVRARDLAADMYFREEFALRPDRKNKVQKSICVLANVVEVWVNKLKDKSR